MSDRIEREKKLHNTRFAENKRKHLSKYYSIISNASKLYEELISDDVSGKKYSNTAVERVVYHLSWHKKGLRYMELISQMLQ